MNFITRALAVLLFCLPALVWANEKVDLIAYTAKVLQRSDQALAIKDKLTIAKLDLDSVQFDYEFQWLPSISLGLTEATKTQGFGVEVKKKSEFGTEFTLGTSYDKIDSDFSSNESPKLYARVEQGLFRQWGREMGRLPLSRAEIFNQRVYLSTIVEKQSLLRKAIQEYFSVILAKKQLALKQASVNRAKENLEVSESRYGLDLVPKTDVYRAKIALLNAQDSQKTEERILNKNFRSLAELINESGADTIELNDEVLEFIVDIPDKFVQIAFSYRSDWKLYELDEKLTLLELKKTESNLLPDIKLSLSAQQYFDEFNVGSNDISDKIDWRIGLSYSSPFSQTREKNALVKQKIRVEQQQRNKKALKRRMKPTLTILLN